MVGGWKECKAGIASFSLPQISGSKTATLCPTSFLGDWADSATFSICCALFKPRTACPHRHTTMTTARAISVSTQSRMLRTHNYRQSRPYHGLTGQIRSRIGRSRRLEGLIHRAVKLWTHAAINPSLSNRGEGEQGANDMSWMNEQQEAKVHNTEVRSQAVRRANTSENFAFHIFPWEAEK